MVEKTTIFLTIFFIFFKRDMRLKKHEIGLKKPGMASRQNK